MSELETSPDGHDETSPAEQRGGATSVALLELARSIAVQAAEFAREARLGGVSVATTKSSPVDIVTAVDRDTEALIRRLILDARPDDGILGEEDATLVGTSGIDWVVDPIDGTVNFLYDMPAWAISIAVVDGPPDPESWTARAGVVVNPSTGEVFEASAGGGARLNGAPLQVNTGVPLSHALVGTGFSYSAEARRAQAEVLLTLLPRARDIRRVGSAALDLCAVAAGRLDAYYERGLNPWDQAAGALIAHEAGARVAGPAGGAATFELTVAAAPSLYEELAATLREAGLNA